MLLKKQSIASPLNYTGGKYKLLPQILPLFPSEINTFVDLFCGGCNIGINIDSDKVICNDNNTKLIGMLNYFKENSYSQLIDKINLIINKYSLSNSYKNGYEHYNCNSSDGLGSYNREHFLKLRQDFNNMDINNEDYFAYLYVLIVYSFNNQIRFNSKGEFNLPVGKRDFNVKMINKLKCFSENLNKIEFTNKQFNELNLTMLSPDDFVYADPPYLITCASYNEQNMWTEDDEIALLELLDNLNAQNIKFGLSNVLESKGRKNQILIDWINSNSNYVCNHLDYNYKNSNYQRKNKDNKVDEVLITNY